MQTIQQSLGKEKATALYNSAWWKEKTPRELVQFQLFTKELCMPFDVFHGAIEKVLDRPIWTHEFGLNFDGIVAEFQGDKPAPSFEDIINLIPEEKRILVIV